MANKNPVKQFTSPWPKRLKELPVKGVLLIEKNELTYTQVQALVTNMNYRNKGKILFRVDGTPETDSIVTCMFRGRGIFADGRTEEARKFKKKHAAPPPKTKPEKIVATSSPTIRAIAAHEPAMAIIEALHGDGGVTVYRATDRAEYAKIMEETTTNMMIVQVQTFALTNTKKRDYSWKDETSPLKG